MATITRTVKSSGGDYSSLSAWEAGRQGNLVTAGNIERAECYTMTDTTGFEIDGWTVDSSNYPFIEGASGQTYNLSVTDAVCIFVYETALKINKISIGNVSPTSGRDILRIMSGYVDAGSYFEFSRMVFIGNNHASHTQSLISINDSDSNVTVFNCLFRNLRVLTNNYAINVNASTTCNCYNNTIVGGEVGIIRGGGNVIAKNNLLYTQTYPCFGTFATGTDYNVTDHPEMHYTVTGGGNTHDDVSQTFTFVDSGNGDYHLASNDAGAIGLGVTDPGSGLFSDDIDGQTRSAPWDCGADEEVSETVTVKPWYYYSQQ